MHGSELDTVRNACNRSCIVTRLSMSQRVAATRQAQTMRHSAPAWAWAGRYGRAWPTTLPDGAATRRPVRSLGIVLVRPGRSVRAARVRWVCTLCTQPSFDSGHCFESLLINTVHEHWSRGFQK